jgi:type IV secretory system conjugative DNA transfer VirD4/TraG family protein/LAGLIDADG DNA endonuclease family protein
MMSRAYYEDVSSFATLLPHGLLLDADAGILLLSTPRLIKPALALGCGWVVRPVNIEVCEEAQCMAIARLHDNLLRSLPKGTALQCGMHVRPATDAPAWEGLRKDREGSHVVHAQVAAVRAGLPHQDGAIAGRLRDITTWITLRLPVAPLDPAIPALLRGLLAMPAHSGRRLAERLRDHLALHMAHLEGLRSGLTSTLQGAGHTVTCLAGHALGSLIAGTLAPHDPHPPLISPELPLAEQVVRSRATQEPGGWTFDSAETPHTARLLTLHHTAPRTYPGMLSAPRAPQGGKPLALWDAWPGALTLVVNVAAVDQAKEKARLQWKRTMAFVQRFTLLGDSSTEHASLKDELDKIFKSFYLTGGQVLWMRAHLVLWGEETPLKRGIDTVIDAGRRLDMEWLPEPVLGSSLFLQTLPLGFDPEWPKERFLQRAKRLPSAIISQLLPLYGGFRGTATASLLYLNQRGETVGFDPFDAPTAPHMIVTGTSGAGKAQPLDAGVLTPHGWTRMGDIQVGDEVIAGDGKPTTVVGVFPQGDKPIYRVTFSDGAQTECCEDHLWLTQTDRERDAASRNKRRPSAQPTVRSLADIRQTLMGEGRRLYTKNHTIPMVDLVEFAEQDVPLDPYLFGVLIGDANMTHTSVTIASRDPDIIDHLVLPNNSEAWRLPSATRCPTWRFRMIKQRGFGKNRAPNPLVATLQRLGLMGKNAAQKSLPAIYKFNSVQKRIALLQGLMDTDGWVQRHSVYISTASAQLAEDITFLVQSLGGTVRRTLKHPTYVYKSERRQGQPAHVLALCLPPTIMPFRLARKVQLVKARTTYQPRRAIVAVDHVGRKPAQCIAVAHPSHLYVTDDFIVTHNSFTMAHLVQQVLPLGASVVILDRLPSYQDLCAAWAGRYVAMDFDNPVCLNPFYGPLDKTHVAFLVASLAEMASGGVEKLTRESLGVLSDAVAYFAQAWTATRQGEEATLSPFIDEVLKTGDFSPDDKQAHGLARELARKLTMFYGRGPYAGFVDGSNTLTLDNALTVVELSRLSHAPDLQSSLLFALMHLLTQFYTAPEQQRRTKFFIADETWALLRHQATAGVLEEIGRTYRKLRTSAIFLSQQPSDFDSPAGRVLQKNAPAKLFLQQDPQELADIQTLFKLADSEVALFAHVRKHAAWSSGYLQLPGKTGGLVRLVPDAYTRWLVSQDDREKAVREQAILRQGGHVREAVALLAQQYPHGLPSGAHL